MSIFNNITLRAKLWIALGVITVALVGMATVSAFSTNRLKSGTIALGESMLPAVDFVVEADRDMQQALVAERSLLYVKAGTPDFDRLVAEQEENIGQARARVEKYLGVSTVAEGKQMAEAYLGKHREWAEVSRQVAKLAGGSDLADKQAALALSFADSAARFASARDLLDRLGEFELQHAEGVVREAGSVATTSFYTMISAAGVGIFLSLMLMLMFPGMVVNPLERLTDKLNEFSAGKGDLTARLNLDRQDEVGELASAFNNFLGSLQNLVADVGAVSPRLAGASSQLCVVAERSSTKTTQQQRETDQVVTAINEMAASIQDIARNAGEAANMAREADAQVGRGDQVVTQTIGEIGRLATSVEDLGGVMQRLNADSQNIGSVLDVIRGIAEQTNLLALNAAIEAARAGEQGRGFAVVADEVRTLASRTQQSTLEIQEMVERLQAAAEEAVSTVQVGRTMAQGTVEHATSTRDVLDAIRMSVSSITGMSMQIASAVEQQGMVAAEVDRNITRISQISEQNAADAAQISTSGEELAGLASELQNHVGRFRV